MLGLRETRGAQQLRSSEMKKASSSSSIAKFKKEALRRTRMSGFSCSYYHQACRWGHAPFHVAIDFNKKFENKSKINKKVRS